MNIQSHIFFVLFFGFTLLSANPIEEKTDSSDIRPTNSGELFIDSSKIFGTWKLKSIKSRSEVYDKQSYSEIDVLRRLQIGIDRDCRIYFDSCSYNSNKVRQVGINSSDFIEAEDLYLKLLIRIYNIIKEIAQHVGAEKVCNTAIMHDKMAAFTKTFLVHSYTGSIDDENNPSSPSDFVDKRYVTTKYLLSETKGLSPLILHEGEDAHISSKLLNLGDINKISLFYVNTSSDITQQVIDQLNKEFPVQSE